jgi:hypothetical protein
MSTLGICQWIESTAFSTSLRESTWGFPILAAAHVLAIAWFGGAVFIGPPDLRAWKRLGLFFVLLTGAVLFSIEPLKCYHSTGFWLKMALLVLVAFANRQSAIYLALSAAIIFAARAIAFF